jgi:methionyl aminopeptidase
MTVDGEDDIRGLRLAGRAVADARDAMLRAIRPGVTTAELDAIARDVLRHHGARSAPQLAYGFPGTTCISVNHEAAHGIPSSTRRLRDGDVVNVDVSAELDGYWADTGASAAVGDATPDIRHLLDATREAQHDGMRAARAGRPLRHIGRAVQRCARRNRLRVIANLCGHGVGRSIHEAPSVPGVEDVRDRTVLWEGLVLAIEPFLSPTATLAVEGDDGWTLTTADGSLAAQFEHTVIVTNGVPIVLTAGDVTAGR